MHCYSKESNPTQPSCPWKKEGGLLLHPSSFPRTTAITVKEREENGGERGAKRALARGRLKKKRRPSAVLLLPTSSFLSSIHQKVIPRPLSAYSRSYLQTDNASFSTLLTLSLVPFSFYLLLFPTFTSTWTLTSCSLPFVRLIVIF